MFRDMHHQTCSKYALLFYNMPMYFVPYFGNEYLESGFILKIRSQSYMATCAVK